MQQSTGRKKVAATTKSWLLEPKGRTVNVMSDCDALTEWPDARVSRFSTRGDDDASATRIAYRRFQ
jgi:hypothetical protein